ncbi:hypothetical protein SAZ11_33525 [Streptomyces sp. FXJ1.4098]|nr:hypothetical protein [Streptomyces sp. FXJ1.4098]
MSPMTPYWSPRATRRRMREGIATPKSTTSVVDSPRRRSTPPAGIPMPGAAG